MCHPFKYAQIHTRFRASVERHALDFASDELFSSAGKA